MQILKAEAISIDGCDDHWSVECPNCSREYEMTGFFDSGEVITCAKCNAKFKMEKLNLDDNHFIN